MVFGYLILRAIPDIHEINALREVFLQRVGKFLLKSIIALCLLLNNCHNQSGIIKIYKWFDKNIISLFTTEVACEVRMPLKGVPFILSPDLLHVLASAGHGDEIGEYQSRFHRTVKPILHFPLPHGLRKDD